ncbi:MAG: phosphoglycerate kinase [Alphaproteobacteria bacterium]|nr:phosphoglycerate kinase [Alphaproteobacteria bacterium]
MSDFLGLNKLNAHGKRVLVRVDFNVPVANQNGQVVVSDASRIDKSLPTIKTLADQGGRIILLAHFGRPNGQRDATQSLRPVYEVLKAKLPDYAVSFADSCVGDAAQAAVAALSNGQILLLENVRFMAAEEANEAGFAQELATLGDAYVNDAFSAAHRAHASTEGVAHLLPAYAGLLMEAELAALAKALEQPARPVAAVVGGSKISTKLDLLSNLLERVDHLFIGGGMANSFLHALDYPVGKSLCEKELIATVTRILDQAAANGRKIHLPTDVVVARAFKAGADSRIAALGDVQADEMILDIGPATVQAWSQVVGSCKTLVWNGPVGAFELTPFEAGTIALARRVAELTNQGQLLSVAGGGDTVAALAKAGVTDQLSYVSLAGGAFLEWMEGKTLPGVAALKPRLQQAA